MPSPFPGMDPYLEHPALWPDVHASLIVAIRETVRPLVTPRYYVAVEQRTYLLSADDLVLIGVPDVAVIDRGRRDAALPGAAVSRSGVLEVEVPMGEDVEEVFLEVREVTTGKAVTVLELLSPVNKLVGRGREAYEEKRAQVLRTRTSLVEVDLLRAGEPMPVVGPSIPSDYRILVSRGATRPRAQLYAWAVREPIPAFPLPLLPEDAEPMVELGTVLHALYERAGYDLRLDYARAPVPPLGAEDAAWAQQLTARHPHPR